LIYENLLARLVTRALKTIGKPLVPKTRRGAPKTPKGLENAPV
jgi:hypothetical protein